MTPLTSLPGVHRSTSVADQVTIRPMNTELHTVVFPPLRELLDGHGIEHSGDKARRAYLARRARELPAPDVREVEGAEADALVALYFCGAQPITSRRSTNASAILANASIAPLSADVAILAIS